MTDQNQPHRSWWEDAIREILVAHGLPWVLSLFKGMVDRQVEDKAKKPGDKTTFGQAMVLLKAEDQNAYDKIMYFNTEYLKAQPTDQEDFQVNAARTGPDVTDTVAFLKFVGNLPDDDTREAFLVSIGYIGARSVDIQEKAAAIAKITGAFLAKHAKGIGSLPSNTGKKLDKAVDDLVQKIETSPRMAQMKTDAEAAAKKAKDDLQKYKDSRRK